MHKRGINCVMAAFVFAALFSNTTLADSVVVGEAPGVESSVETVSPKTISSVAPTTSSVESGSDTGHLTEEKETTKQETIKETTKQETLKQETQEIIKANALPESEKEPALKPISPLGSTSAESTKAETSKTETTKAETSKAETTKAETTKAETSKAETEHRTDTLRAGSPYIIHAGSSKGEGQEDKGPGIKLLAKNQTQETEETKAKFESETDKKRREMVQYARQFVGLRYIWGGSDLTKGVDCSGLTQQIYKKLGISTGRTSRDQAARGREIPMSEIKPGDLIVYEDGTGYINHITMYLGGNELINASSAETGVIICDIGYRTPLKAIRFFED